MMEGMTNRRERKMLSAEYRVARRDLVKLDDELEQLRNSAVEELKAKITDPELQSLFATVHELFETQCWARVTFRQLECDPFEVDNPRFKNKLAQTQVYVDHFRAEPTEES